MELFKGNCSSKFNGVCFCGDKRKFRAMVQVNKCKIYLGYFESDIDAALAYDKYIIENKLNRRLNFMDEVPESPIPNTRLIRLTQGKFAIVDEEDYERVSQYRWFVSIIKDRIYAKRWVKIDGVKTSQFMHRFIMDGCSDQIDHWNRDGLHNYKSNLRHATNAQNQYNKRKVNNASSEYKGVSLHKRDNKFYCSIAMDGRQYWLGSFYDEVLAAKTYDAKAIELFGEFARLNFPL